MVTSVVALPLLGGGLTGVTGTEDAVPDSNAEFGGLEAGSDSGLTAEALSMGSAGADPATPSQPQEISQDHEDALVDGVEDGIELAQSQGIDVTQEQRAAAVDGARDSVGQHQEASVEQVQEATKGAVHGSVMQAQRVDAEQIQYAVGGATGGALSQSQTVNASQMRSATWGATHGALAQAHHQRVTVDAVQVATYGAAAGAANEAGQKGIDRKPTIQEAAQGAAYGGLAQYQKITVEQRQQITLEHVQHATAGASAGALEGSTEIALEQRQLLEVEQYQRVDVKQVQKAATGAAKGALVQRQEVTIEQTQAAARGAGKGSLIQVQSVRVEQIQRISITAIQQASFGAAKGSIQQSQEATVEQIQAAADGAAQGTLVQHQTVSITQIQYAAAGSASGAIESALQYQIVEIERIQAAARGAGEGAVLQTQIVDITQVQQLARGASSGVLVQHQEATITQLQIAARSAGQETARAIQYQRISITQIQVVTQETASEVSAYAIAEETDDEDQLGQFVEVEVAQKLEEVDELEGTATVAFSDQESTGDSVTIDSVALSEDGFVAVYDGSDFGVDSGDVRGVSEHIEPGEHEGVEIDLDEPLAESGSLVAVAHHDTTDDETFQYANTDGIEDEPYVTDGGSPITDGAFVTLEGEPDEPIEDEPEATLAVSDQTGDGETLTVEEANASVEYALAVTDENGDERGETDPIDANEPVENGSVDLEPPLEAETVLDVAVVSMADGETLATETIEYTLGEPVEELSVEYVDCTELEVTGTLEEGDSLVPRTLWYDSIGPGGTVFPGVTAGDEIDAPFTGTVVMTVGEEYEIDQLDSETVVLEVPDEGSFGSFVVPWFDPADSAEEQLASPPEDLECGGEIQPDEPTITVEDVESTGSGSFDVTFGYENPNDAALTGGGFVEGTTADEPVDELSVGDGEFTVEWAPEDDAERLIWEIPMESFGYDESVRAETEPADEYEDPIELDVEFVDCSRAEVMGSFEEGETIIATTAFYESGGLGNTMGEYAIAVGDDVDAPLEGTVAFEVGDEYTITETEEGALVEIPISEFGTAITGVSSPEAVPGSIDYPNPDGAACLEDVRPELPVIDVVDATPTGEGIDVTFGYENPNDGSLAVTSEFVEGTTADEPVDDLSAGDGEFTVEWTPVDGDEQLVWEIDMSNYDYDAEEWPVASTATAGEIDPSFSEEGEPTEPETPDDPPTGESPFNGDDPFDGDDQNEDSFGESEGVASENT
ncbi:DUF7282 domain-containing protein [Natrarchaeobius halalkaliphilus]